MKSVFKELTSFLHDIDLPYQERADNIINSIAPFGDKNTSLPLDISFQILEVRDQPIALGMYVLMPIILNEKNQNLYLKFTDEQNGKTAFGNFELNQHHKRIAYRNCAYLTNNMINREHLEYLIKGGLGIAHNCVSELLHYSLENGYEPEVAITHK